MVRRVNEIPSPSSLNTARILREMVQQEEEARIRREQEIISRSQGDTNLRDSLPEVDTATTNTINYSGSSILYGYTPGQAIDIGNAGDTFRYTMGNGSWVNGSQEPDLTTNNMNMKPYTIRVGDDGLVYQCGIPKDQIAMNDYVIGGDMFQYRGVVEKIHGNELGVRVPEGLLEVGLCSDGLWGAYYRDNSNRLIKRITIPTSLNYDGRWEFYDSKDHKLISVARNGDKKVELAEGLKNNVLYAPKGKYRIFTITDVVDGLFTIQNRTAKFVVPIDRLRIFKSREDAIKVFEEYKAYAEKLLEIPAEIKRKEDALKAAFKVKVGNKVRFASVTVDANKVSDDLRRRVRDEPTYQQEVFECQSLRMPLEDKKVLIRDRNNYTYWIHEDCLDVISEAQFKEARERIYFVQLGANYLRVAKESAERSRRTTAQLFSDAIKQSRLDDKKAVELASKSTYELGKKIVEDVKSRMDLVRKNKNVQNLDFDEARMFIRIKTNPISIRHVESSSGEDKTAHFLKTPLNIGQFEVTIDFLNAQVHAERITRISGIHGTHPHISGGICWGNMRDEVNEALRKLDAVTICDILFEILEKVRMGDCYISIDDFWDGCPV